MRKQIRHISIKCLLIAMVLWSHNAFALLADSKAPIDIKAETVVIDERKGLSIYTGDAKITQGSLVLSAEIIKILSQKNKVTQVIVQGSAKQRAYYRQNQQNQSRFIEASATHITYKVQQGFIRLKGNAHLVRGFDSFSGHTLNYDIKNDKIVAKQSKDGIQRVRFKIKL